MKKLYISLIVLSLIWGTSFLFIKILVEEIGSWGVVLFRCLPGALTLYIVLLFQKSRVNWKGLPWGALIFVGLTNAALPWWLIATSEMRISSGMASILNATTPIFTSLVGFILFAVRLKGKEWLGIVIAFIGILVVLNFDLTSFLNEDLIGVGTMLAATLCYGLASQSSKRSLTGVSVAVTTSVVLTVGTVVALIGMLWTKEPLPMAMFTFWSFYVLILGLGVLGSGFGFLLYFYMIKEGSAEFATTVTYLVPVTALFWGVLLLDETISVSLLIGLSLILFGVFLSTRQMKQTRS